VDPGQADAEEGAASGVQGAVGANVSDDLISRKALLARYDGKDGRDEEYIGNIREAIRTAPTVDAAPVVHAQWDAQGWEDDITGKWHRCGYRCSYCGQHSAIKWPGCPWCRSKMDGEQREAVRA
jgi:hypothetical protein